LWSAVGELKRAKSRISDLEDEVDRLSDEVEESSESRESLLRLMESYKGGAYEEILSELSVILKAQQMKEEWEEQGARVEKVRVEVENSPKSVPLKFRVQSQVKAIISIGETDGVRQGMRFRVLDPELLDPYGIITVLELAPSGALCEMSDEFDSAIWGEVVDCVKNGESKIIEMPRNVLDPVIPSNLRSLEPEIAEKLAESIRSIPETEVYI